MKIQKKSLSIEFKHAFLPLLLYIREVPSSNLNLETGYPDHEVLHSFLQYLQAYARIAP
jgi:hypothetical protein